MSTMRKDKRKCAKINKVKGFKQMCIDSITYVMVLFHSEPLKCPLLITSIEKCDNVKMSDKEHSKTMGEIPSSHSLYCTGTSARQPVAFMCGD